MSKQPKPSASSRRAALREQHAHEAANANRKRLLVRVGAVVAVMAALGARHMDETIEQRLARFGRIGTIDLRVDFLRPAIGDRFDLSAEVIRIGSRVASTRMEFRGADGTLLSTGTAAYIVS